MVVLLGDAQAVAAAANGVPAANGAGAGAADQQTAPAPMGLLSHSWEACACLQFVRIFGPMLGLAPLSREALERSLADPGASGGALPALQWRLLQPGTAPCPEGDGWYAELRRACANGGMPLEPALAERLEQASYAELEPRERLLLLLALCNAVAPECDATELTHLDGTADDMRIEPMGTDGNRRNYFWFGDTHLFRERGVPSGDVNSGFQPEEYAWEMAAANSEEWRALLTTAATGKGPAPAALRSALSELLEDTIVPMEQRRERQARQQEKQERPRERLSARQQLLEVERLSRLAAEEEVARRRREEEAARQSAEQAREAEALADLRAEWERKDLEEATARVLAAAQQRGVQLTRTQLQERAQEEFNASRALLRSSLAAGSSADAAGAGAADAAAGRRPAASRERKHAEESMGAAEGEGVAQGEGGAAPDGGGGGGSDGGAAAATAADWRAAHAPGGAESTSPAWPACHPELPSLAQLPARVMPPSLLPGASCSAAHSAAHGYCMPAGGGPPSLAAAPLEGGSAPAQPPAWPPGVWSSQ